MRLQDRPRLVGLNGDFCTGACLAGDCLDLYSTVMNLGYFLLKQTLYQIRMGSGYRNPGALGGVLHLKDIYLDTLCGTEGFSLYLLALI